MQGQNAAYKKLGVSICKIVFMICKLITGRSLGDLVLVPGGPAGVGPGPDPLFNICFDCKMVLQLIYKSMEKPGTGTRWTCGCRAVT